MQALKLTRDHPPLALLAHQPSHSGSAVMKRHLTSLISLNRECNFHGHFLDTIKEMQLGKSLSKIALPWKLREKMRRASKMVNNSTSLESFTISNQHAYASFQNVPMVVKSRLDLLRRNFLWEGQNDEKKMYLMKWSKVITPVA